jgi:hypothetical protein
VEGIKFWSILSLKIQKNYKKMGFEGKMNWMCSHLGPTTHVTLSIHQGRQFFLFCHYDISQTMVSWVMLWNLSSKSSQWIGVHWLGLECLELQCGTYFFFNHFFIDFCEKPRLKTIFEFGGILGIIGKPLLRLIS